MERTSFTLSITEYMLEKALILGRARSLVTGMEKISGAVGSAVFA
ncbi:hypothetical protein ACJJIG_00110 [Microbulbifer sp. SSSA007]